MTSAVLVTVTVLVTRAARVGLRTAGAFVAARAATTVTTARTPPIRKTRMHCFFLLAGAFAPSGVTETRGLDCLAPLEDAPESTDVNGTLRSLTKPSAGAMNLPR